MGLAKVNTGKLLPWHPILNCIVIIWGCDARQSCTDGAAVFAGQRFCGAILAMAKDYHGSTDALSLPARDRMQQQG